MSSPVKIVIEVGGTQVHMTTDEAREVHQQLGRIFGLSSPTPVIGYVERLQREKAERERLAREKHKSPWLPDVLPMYPVRPTYLSVPR